jgi:hypothetical protein
MKTPSATSPKQVVDPSILDAFIRANHGGTGDANLGRAHKGEMTYQQIADHFGCSREAVRRSANRILRSSNPLRYRDGS